MTDPGPGHYLGCCDVVDVLAPEIVRVAGDLRANDALETARRCFEFVRDEIKHSSDYQLDPVTCRASQVLHFGTGYCYAKSHLLCALLRANKIPAGLCYQRLTIKGDKSPFCLHGLCAVYLHPFGWYRVDPRGNRDGIDAQFDPPHEKLAFSTKHPGERDLPGIYVSPIDAVVDCLTRCSRWDQVSRNLPDIKNPGRLAIESARRGRAVFKS